MILLIVVTVAIFLLGCNGFSDKVNLFIPGTYLASWKTAFSIAIDTMTIAGDGEGFLITRRTHLQFINAAKQRAPEYSITKWQGNYSASDKTLIVRTNGRVMNFDPNNKILRMGAIVYRKL